MNADLLKELEKSVGQQGFLKRGDVSPKYWSDWRGSGDCRPDFVLRPENTEELSRIMQICHRAGQRVVAQGGMTGLVAGARPQAGEVPISFERMSRVEGLDRTSGTITVQSGTPLQTVQEKAEQNGFFYPLDLGARGSCTVGGMLSTNAGGNRVIRFGMTREQVLGIEVVLADGTIVNSLNSLVKNNTGYDLKQLFIGSEGTLGLITRAVLRLEPKPLSQTVAFCGVPGFDAVVKLMRHLQSELGGGLSAFEVLWQSTYTTTVESLENLRKPISSDFPFYVLVEAMGGNDTRDRDLFEMVIGGALQRGLVADAVVSKSLAEVAELWLVRDSVAEAMALQRPAVSYDVSLAIADMEYFANEVEKRLSTDIGTAKVFIGGHLGDGNLHLVVHAVGHDPQPAKRIDDIVYGLVGALDGSISAEHGIGLAKREYLSQSRNAAELALMRVLKHAMDPKGLLGRDRIFEF
ncbi:MAG: FAD-binding oxidoreductase [Alphaproteobacteria bacterium]|nr:FAD-binding oxidoreductase [Alphaproteobacteria bacterium]